MDFLVELLKAGYNEVVVKPLTVFSNGMAAFAKLLTKLVSKLDSHKFNISFDIMAFIFLLTMLIYDYDFEYQGIAKFVITVSAFGAIYWCGYTQLYTKTPSNQVK